MNVKINLCETCKKQPECFQKGISERGSCEDCEPLSVEEQLEKDEFIEATMVGLCPKCGSENTVDCEYEPSIEDITIGACLDCGAHWCSECGYVLKGKGKSCPHWGFCGNCSAENGYLTLDEFIEKICPTCEYFDEGCQLEDPSECKKGVQFLCPYEEDVSNCPQLRKYLKQVG